MTQPKPKRNLHNIIESCLIDPARSDLLFIERLCVEPGGDLRLDTWAIRPAEPGVVTVGAQLGIGGRTGPTNPGAPNILRFIVFLLTFLLLPQSTSEDSEYDCMLIQSGREWITTSSKQESTSD